MQIGDFLLKDRIDIDSSYGTLFYAENYTTHENAVLKINNNNSVENLARFNRENTALYDLSPHNGIIAPLTRVCSCQLEKQDINYYAMERAETNLDCFLYNQTLNTFNNRLDLFIQICEALQHSHEIGYVHRDLHKGNVLLNTTPYIQIKLIDFGRAYDLNSCINLSIEPAWGYLVTPPEVRFGLVVDPNKTNYCRGDIFALGILWKYLFCSPIDTMSQMFSIAATSVDYIKSKSANYYTQTTKEQRLAYYEDWIKINNSTFNNIYEISNFDIELANKMTEICKLMLNFNPEERTDNIQDIINSVKGLK